MNNHFIYLYTFPNGKHYIGQTFENSGRCGNPTHYKKNKNGKPQRVWYAMMKYKTFQVDILKDNLSLEEANYWETYYIKEYDSIIDHNKGYNCDYGGNNHKLSEYTKIYLSEINKGKHLSKDTKRKISENSYYKNKFGKDNPTSKSVLQYSKDGEFIKEWNSMMDIQRNLNISVSNICNTCKGKLKSCGGYVWKYKEV